jgi:hypothetical protein
MGKPREFLIRTMKDESRNLDWYPNGVIPYNAESVPEKGCIHVIEYSAYQKLKDILARKPNENDDLGSEYVHVSILKEKLAIAVEALEKYSKRENFKKIWDDNRNPTDMDYYFIRGEYSISDFEVPAREALAKIKGGEGE